MVRASDILTFWFEEAGPDHWFSASNEFDTEIRMRFECVAKNFAPKVGQNMGHQWEVGHETSLALIILLDQFPRNMYRNTPAAFGWDSLALLVSERMVEKGWDTKVEMPRRSFIYMPYMH